MALRMQWGKAIVEVPPADEPVPATAVARSDIDCRTFEQLYRTYLGPVYGYCYRRLGSVPAAEDATQQVFTRAYARLHTCREESFRGWLFAIAHNVTANVVRSWHPDVSLDAVVDLPANSASPEELAINEDLSIRLRSAMRQLTPDQRDVIELRYCGVSVSETANILRTSEGAVKQLQHRATLRLRTLLGYDSAGRNGHGI